MSKTILSEVDGFTPIIDCIVSDTSLMSAVVFGRMWRFCQMQDGVCKASLETISRDIGIDRSTVMRHAHSLVEAGYLKDLTPGLRNKPHVYADTGKAGLSISVTVAQRNSSEESVAQRNATVAENNATVAESQLNKVLKKDSKDIEEEKEKQISQFSYWDTIVDILIRNNRYSPTSVYRQKLEACTPVGWEPETSILTISCPEPDWMTAHFQKTVNNMLGALNPNATIIFAKHDE